MKTKITSLIAFSYLLIFVSLASCSKDLSRDAAENKLKTLKPDAITRHINSSYGPGIRIPEFQFKDPKTFREYEEPLDKLKVGGWITYEKKTDSAQLFSQRLYGLSYEVHFADKLKPFIVERDQSGVDVMIAKREFDKVTGITKQDQNTCIVEFMTKVIPTELTSVFPLEKHEADPMKHTRTFRLFDDGWRMQ